MKGRSGFAAAVAWLALSALAGGCASTRRAGPESPHSPAAGRETPHAAYAHGLDRAGLASTALGAAWLAAARSALATMAAVPLPHRELGVFDAARPSAVAWQLELRAGNTLMVDASLDGDEPARLFVDLLRWDGAAWVAAAGGDDGTLRHDLARDGTYALRLQPELLRGGRWALTARASGGLAFPVPGAEGRALIGRFGDTRDGGARRHEGIDIPAPRGTPAVAAADALVSDVSSNGRGGKVVWLVDRRGRTLYYAHLDEQLVRRGQRVRAGDVVGRVGNTGNAAGTSPHLHFGVYAGGAVDPLPLLVRQQMPPVPQVAPGLLGGWGRLRTSGVRLRVAPSTTATVVGELAAHTAVHVGGASGEWLRVALPAGVAAATHGWIHGSLVDSAAQPLFSVSRDGALLQARPDPGAPASAVLDSGAVPVLATVPGWWLVATPAGGTGWLPAAGPGGATRSAAGASGAGQLER